MCLTVNTVNLTVQVLLLQFMASHQNVEQAQVRKKMSLHPQEKTPLHCSFVPAWKWSSELMRLWERICQCSGPSITDKSIQEYECVCVAVYVCGSVDRFDCMYGWQIEFRPVWQMIYRCNFTQLSLPFIQLDMMFVWMHVRVCVHVLMHLCLSV